MPATTLRSCAAKPAAIERLEAGGIPLGIQENVPYESGTVTLQSGDWLVIFTDGVVEAENVRAEEYGESRLLDHAACEYRGGSLDAAEHHHAGPRPLCRHCSATR